MTDRLKGLPIEELVAELQRRVELSPELRRKLTAVFAEQIPTRGDAIELESRPSQSPYAGSGERSITTFRDGIFTVSH